MLYNYFISENTLNKITVDKGSGIYIDKNGDLDMLLISRSTRLEPDEGTSGGKFPLGFGPITSFQSSWVTSVSPYRKC